MAEPTLSGQFGGGIHRLSIVKITGPLRVIKMVNDTQHNRNALFSSSVPTYLSLWREWIF